MNRYIFFTILLLIATACGAQADLSAWKLVEQGRQAESLSLTMRAEEHYKQAAADSSEWHIPTLQLGLLYETMGYNDRAIQMLRQALSLCDTSATIYEHLVYNYIESNDYDGQKNGGIGSIEDLEHLAERALELNPHSTSACASMALIYNHRKNYTNAMHWANRALQEHDKSPRVYNTLGLICYNQGKDNNAISHFRKALELDDKNVDTYLNLGAMFTARGNHESAINYLRKGLQQSPKSIKLHYLLGKAYLQRGDVQRATLCYETIIQQLDSLYTPAYNMLGTIYNKKGDYDKAVAYHQKACRIAPSDAESYKCLGKTHTDRGDYVKALRSYQKAVQINDKDHETYCLMAHLYNKQNNKARETASYKKAAKLGNKEAQQWMARNGMAW
ncbi:MAG: tetratricopeptide repeat protein [Bacteroidales bacterium]|nr:tetratricopeptide repeat protein [Bacteroidales bacterium]